MTSIKFRFFVIIISILIIIGIIIYAVTVHKNGSESDDQSNANSTGSRANSSLKLLIVVSRHGNRSPISWCPGCPFQGSNRTVWPWGVGQLAQRGRIQMYNLGVKLRSLYNGFLSEYYYPEEFQASSTLVTRTMMSAAQLLAGLFPPKGFQVWNSEFPWQPIPILPVYLDHNTMVSAPDSCPLFKEARTNSTLQFEETYEANITALLVYLQTYTELASFSVSSLSAVWEPLICADVEGYSLPSWAEAVYPEPMATLIDKRYRSLSIGSDTMIRLLQGLYFQELMGLMESKVNSSMPSESKMYYFSGHDFTIIGLQGILGFHDDSLGIVQPGSAMLFELHQDQADNYYIEVLYINGVSSDLKPMKVNIPNCGTPCYFSTLISLTEKYYNITDYNQECQISRT